MPTYTIGIAEMKIAKAPDKITTLGLGSCLGLVLYDPGTKVSGMVHIMLPSAQGSTNPGNKYKFADTAIVEMIRELSAAGAQRSKLRAKVAGGAHMFRSLYTSDALNIGERNIEICKKTLKKQAIPLLSEDTGGQSGRSIEFDCESSNLQVRTVSPKSVRLI